MSKMQEYSNYLKKTKEVEKDNLYTLSAIRMFNNLQTTLDAEIIDHYRNKGVGSVVGHEYYRGAEELSKLISEHTDGELKVHIDHFDHWSGDDHDVSYIYVPVEDIQDLKQVKAAFKILKKYAPNAKLTIQTQETWD